MNILGYLTVLGDKTAAESRLYKLLVNGWMDGWVKGTCNSNHGNVAGVRARGHW